MLKKVISVVLSLCVAVMICVPAIAAGFTPSATSKAAPEIIPVTDENGNEFAAIIYDENEEIVSYVPYGEIIVTPYSGKNVARLEEIKSNLEEARKQIERVNSLEDLCKQLGKAVAEVADNVVLSNLVVRDLFDVVVTGTYADYLAIEGNHITITFDLKMSSDLLMAVLHNIGGETWEAVMGNRLVRSGNTASCTFYSLSAVAFVVEGDELPVDANGPTSPETNSISDITYIFAVVIIAAAAVCGIVLVKSKKKNSAAD